MLSDRSAEAAEILSEIDVERGKREAAQKAVKDFTFATNEQRQSMTQNFAALQRVLATGDINSVPDKFRAAVGQLLDQFKDFDPTLNEERFDCSVTDDGLESPGGR